MWIHFTFIVAITINIHIHIHIRISISHISFVFRRTRNNISFIIVDLLFLLLSYEIVIIRIFASISFVM